MFEKGLKVINKKSMIKIIQNQCNEQWHIKGIQWLIIKEFKVTEYFGKHAWGLSSGAMFCPTSTMSSLVTLTLLGYTCERVLCSAQRTLARYLALALVLAQPHTARYPYVIVSPNAGVTPTFSGLYWDNRTQLGTPVSGGSRILGRGFPSLWRKPMWLPRKRPMLGGSGGMPP